MFNNPICVIIFPLFKYDLQILYNISSHKYGVDPQCSKSQNKIILFVSMLTVNTYAGILLGSPSLRTKRRIKIKIVKIGRRNNKIRMN